MYSNSKARSTLKQKSDIDIEMLFINNTSNLDYGVQKDLVVISVIKYFMDIIKWNNIIEIC